MSIGLLELLVGKVMVPAVWTYRIPSFSLCWIWRWRAVPVTASVPFSAEVRFGVDVAGILIVSERVIDR